MFEKHEIKNLIKLADAVKTKDFEVSEQAIRKNLNSATQYVKGMRDISQKIQELHRKYAEYAKEFNKVSIFFQYWVHDPNLSSEFTKISNEKQGIDKIVLGR